tara:strand:+ start:1999 stop:3612 length:1614 start_codon:yes stop_codon:yes gene_type:complete
MDSETITSNKGYLSFVLHAHLPFINHPEYDYFFEENWLFQAITESYIPTLQLLERLEKEGLDFSIVYSLSPTLLSMLDNSGLQERYLRHLDNLLLICEAEIKDPKVPEEQVALSKYYKTQFENCRAYFVQYKANLIGRFVRLHKNKKLELITTTATHAVLPLYNSIPETILAQLKVGKIVFEKFTGIDPEGLWLPECAYCKGLEDFIKKAGYKYTFLDTTSIEFASPNIENNIYRITQAKNGVQFMARDPESSHQVWSAETGYPSDSDYREYHKDLADDSDSPQIQQYIGYFRHRCQSGLKYWSVAEKNGKKLFYDPQKASIKAKYHAREFMLDKRNQLRNLHQKDQEFLITAPFDAELFGHWWHEGPIWLEEVIRIANRQGDFTLGKPSSSESSVNCSVEIQPEGATWGKNSSLEHWVNPTNDWIYPQLFQAVRQFQKILLTQFQTEEVISDELDRTLKQAARSLLLAQSSDWAFMIRTGSSQKYAFKRVKDSLARFNFLAHSILNKDIPKRKLLALEIMDDIFPEIDYHLLSQTP